ncbi:Lhr family ATP-dependent helicase [Escherichia coli]
MRVIEQLAGVGLPASLWESQILPARVRDYSPEMLDELLATGAVIWSGQKKLGEDDGLVALHLQEYAAESFTRRSGSGESFGAAASDNRCSG